MADHRLDLPDGAWADIRDPKKVSWGARKPVKRAMVALAQYRQQLIDDKPELAEEAEQNPALLVSAESLEMIEAMQEANVVAFVADWSFDLPVNGDSLQELPGDVVEALMAECDGLSAGLWPDTEPSPDENSPT